MTSFHLPNVIVTCITVALVSALLVAAGGTGKRTPEPAHAAPADTTSAPEALAPAELEMPVRSVQLGLPTDNDALLRGDGPSFYMYTHRNFNGVRSRPWQGGQFGFVRNPKNTREGIVYTRYHGGVDIRPVRRDRQGNPVDRVRAVSNGEVVYVNHAERNSTYGLYVVVEHWWNGAPYYSLYAHLNQISVRRGEFVKKGGDLGLMGYTGAGIDRQRAHLHLEINMLMSGQFQRWYDRGSFRTRNLHGNYNGMNMMGLDVAELYLALQADSTLTIPDFIRSKEIFFEVAVPNAGPLDILYRYPWLLSHSGLEKHRSWIFSFTQSGLPVRIAPSLQAVREPTVINIRRSGVQYADLTRGLVDGTGESFRLSRRGQRHIDLLTAVQRG